MKTYLEYKDHASQKFWEIEVVDSAYTIRYGKTGTKGRTTVKSFDNPEKAQAAAQKQIASKIKKGYVAIDEEPAVWEPLDWDTFNPKHHFETLRSYLNDLEQKEGVGKIHQQATQKLMELGMVLRHPHIHEAETSGFAISPDGRYFATGCGCGENFEDGGSLVIWETATGNPVESRFVEDGVGWDGHEGMIQWSPDGRSVGAAYHTNFVGNFSAPGQAVIESEIVLTNGWDRPPDWCWGADSQHIGVFCWGDSMLPVGIAKLDSGWIDEGKAKWMTNKIPEDILTTMGEDPKDFEDEDAESPFEPFTHGGFSEDMTVFYGATSDGALGVSLKTGEIIYYIKAFRPLWNSNGSLMIAESQVYDGLTGVLLNNEVPKGSVYWSNIDPAIAAIYTPEKQLEIWDVPKSKLLQKIAGVPHPGKRFPMTDFPGLSWAPDGKKIVVRSGDQKVSVYELGTDSEQHFTFESPIQGIYFGADNNLIGFSETELQFLNMGGQSIYRRFSFSETLQNWGDLKGNEPHPLQLNEEDFGNAFDLHPAYGMLVGKEADWILAFETGLVVAPKKVHQELDDHLFYVFEDQWGWPYRWGQVPAVSTLKDAIGNPLLPLSKAALKALSPKKGKSKKRKVVLPETGEKGFEEFLEKLLTNLEGLGERWQVAQADARQELAGLVASRGNYTTAFDILINIIDPFYRVQGMAKAGIEWWHAGKIEHAKKAYAAVEIRIKDPAIMNNRAFILPNYGPGAALAQLLGHEKTAKEWFELALGELDAETARFQEFASLASDFFSCGEKEKAKELIFAERFKKYQSHHLSEFLQHVGANGTYEELIAYLKKLIELGVVFNSDEEIMLIIRQYIIDEQQYQQVEEWEAVFSKCSSHYFLLPIIEAMGRDDKSAAIALVRGRIEKYNTYASSTAKWGEVLSRIEGVEMGDVLDELVSKFEELTQDMYPEKVLRQFATAMSRGGRVEKVKSFIPDLTHEKLKLALLQGIAKGAPSKVNDAAISTFHIASLAGGPNLEGAKSLWQTGAIDEANEVFDELRKVAAKAGSDKRWELDKVMKAHIKVGDFQGAYLTLKKHTPGNRKIYIRDLALACVKAGWTDAAYDLIMQEDTYDFNNQTKALLQSIRIMCGKTKEGKVMVP